MTKKDIQDHKVVASKMNWDELAETIMGLESEVVELKQYLKKNEIKKYHILIEIYETEKAQRLAEFKCTGSYFGFEYGHDYVSSWNDDY